MSVQTEIDRIITEVGAAYDAVEAKGGTLPASETVANLAEAISSIPKETHQAVEQATPSLSLNVATGVVTAEATQAAGLVAAGTKKATMQLATQAAKTVMPSAAQQTAVASEKYTTGNVVVAAVPTEAKTVELSMPSGDQTVTPSSGKFLSAVTVKKPATMLPENIKKGVSIGGVVGTLETSSSGGGSSSETWVLDSEAYLAPSGGETFNASFKSNGLPFSSITLTVNMRRQILYDNTVIKAFDKWTSEAYRKLTFNAPPTGNLLTWLQANGVKQPANLAVQPSKDVTITSNGTIGITPDVPYNVLEHASVTVDVPTSGVASTTVKITAIMTNDDSIDILGITSGGQRLSLFLDAGTPTAEIEIIQNSPLVLNCSNVADISGTNCGTYFNPTYKPGSADMYLYAVVFTDGNDNPTASGTLRIAM